MKYKLVRDNKIIEIESEKYSIIRENKNKENSPIESILFESNYECV